MKVKNVAHKQHCEKNLDDDCEDHNDYHKNTTKIQKKIKI